MDATVVPTGHECPGPYAGCVGKARKRKRRPAAPPGVVARNALLRDQREEMFARHRWADDGGGMADTSTGGAADA